MGGEAERYDYIFGFGSIMNTTTHATWQTAADKSVIPGAVATIKKCFGYKRKWNFRSSTGFTALGVILASEGGDDEASDINGVLFRVPKDEVPNFDRREVGYEKVEVPLSCVDFRPDMTGPTSQTTFSIGPGDKIWLYVPLPSQTMYADENHPLLQSYVDTVLQGCLEWGGEPMAEEFVLTTGGWSCYYLNDTPSSRRPWLFRKQYATIDQVLSKHSALTNYSDRRHPEEFASAFAQRMKGTWALPRRNPNFTGRESELEKLRSLFSSQDVGRQRVVKIEVAGLGGVGKSQLVTEYCYRHYPEEYGLVVWLNAETADTLITDYRHLLSDLAAVDADIDKTTEEIVGEVRTRLFRSNVPWLLVFDNLEDHSLLGRFVPRGAGSKGHVLVTTRHTEAVSGIDSNGILSLGCLTTPEAIELLRRSAGSHNMDEQGQSASKLCEKLGNLPLALSMASAYMRQCDVTCNEYLERYLASEKNGQSLLHRGKLQDYSLSVASSLLLILPKIEEESRTTTELLHLLSFLSPDGITKSLLRSLLGAKNNFDQTKENSRQATMAHRPIMFCSLLLGVAALLLPAASNSRHRAGICVVLSASVLVLSRDSAIKTETAATQMKRITSASGSFSAFEYEQSDLSWNILKNFSLLSVKEGKGSVHRLLQQSLRSCQTEGESLYYASICVDAMLECWKFRPDNTETWAQALQILEHVKSVVAHCQDYGFAFGAERSLSIVRLSKEAGILSSMALNAFVEALNSFEVSLKLIDMSTFAKRKEFRLAKAEVLHQLSKVHRYTGEYDDAQKCLIDSLDLNNRDDRLRADALHEMGIIQVKKHNLDSATSFLQQSLEIRRGLEVTDSDQINASSTLHQLAAIHVARKPPSLEKAKALLQEALSLSRQIGQRAATMKQLARVTIRQGFLDQGESYLAQAEELYLELYGNNNHINVAAVKFQQGALALQCGMLDSAWQRFNECLQIRQSIYAYARSSDDSYPTHLEVSCVLHELAAVGFSRKRFAQAIEMLLAERAILEKLAESANSDRVYQARLTNLTWLRKSAKEMNDEEKATLYSNEKLALKKQSGHALFSEPKHGYLECESIRLQEKAIQCRLLAREFALEKADSQVYQNELLACMDELGDEIRIAKPGPMKQAASQFRETLLLWVNKQERRSAILSACDNLRDVLRGQGVRVNDSICTKRTTEK